MNTLLFLTCGLGLLSFLRAAESERNPNFILKECFFVFAGICIFSGAGFMLRAFSPMTVLEIQLALSAVFFILNSAFQRDISFFAAVCGIAFWILESPFSPEHTGASVLFAGAFYTVFRLALWSFQTKALFYRPPSFFAGYPALVLQAFWTSLILTVLALFLA